MTLAFFSFGKCLCKLSKGTLVDRFKCPPEYSTGVLTSSIIAPFKISSPKSAFGPIPNNFFIVFIIIFLVITVVACPGLTMSHRPGILYHFVLRNLLLFYFLLPTHNIIEYVLPT